MRSSRVSGGDEASLLLAPRMHAAAQTELDMQRVVEWVDQQDTETPTEVLTILGADAARVQLQGIADLDARSRSSIYMSAAWLLAAYRLPSVQATSQPGLTPETFLNGKANTLYIVASSRQQRLLRPLIVAINQTEELTRTDELTGLANRRGFHLHLQQRRRTDVLAGRGLLLIDCDRFKGINDEHGHLVGDRVLQGVANILRSAAGPDDIACRLGGDEFCLLVKAEQPRRRDARRRIHHRHRARAARAAALAAADRHAQRRRLPGHARAATGTTGTRWPTPRCTAPSAWAATAWNGRTTRSRRPRRRRMQRIAHERARPSRRRPDRAARRCARCC